MTSSYCCAHSYAASPSGGSARLVRVESDAAQIFLPRFFAAVVSTLLTIRSGVHAVNDDDDPAASSSSSSSSSSSPPTPNEGSGGGRSKSTWTNGCAAIDDDGSTGTCHSTSLARGERTSSDAEPFLGRTYSGTAAPSNDASTARSVSSTSIVACDRSAPSRVLASIVDLNECTGSARFDDRYTVFLSHAASLAAVARSLAASVFGVSVLAAGAPKMPLPGPPTTPAAACPPEDDAEGPPSGAPLAGGVVVVAAAAGACEEAAAPSAAVVVVDEPCLFLGSKKRARRAASGTSMPLAS
mmetsp:Transcript_25939/g.103712  ORF Transcript_25939/g.103712 Transcript_25939/m.103712 type:complete len:298 (-) Transcript_25939:479-1372(-)